MSAIKDSASKPEAQVHPSDFRPACVKSVAIVRDRYRRVRSYGHHYNSKSSKKTYSSAADQWMRERARKGREYAARHGKTPEEMLGDLLDRGGGID